MNDSQKVEFTPPKDFTPPAGSEGGEEFDLVCSFKAKEGGTICMTKLGDAKMPGYDDEGESHKPDYKEYAQSMSQQMMGGNQEGY